MYKLCLYIISAVCLWVLSSAIVINFAFSKRTGIKKEKKSVVETGSMFAFFIVMVYMIYIKFGFINCGNGLYKLLTLSGTAFIVIGTAINIIGRFTLKSNWGNQIRIYDDHELIRNGIYKFIRHPLYSSTILMIYGLSLLFCNLSVFIFNTVIFIPFMIYRAKQEEKLLAETFEEYKDYKKNTGMFIPKLKR